MKLTNEHFPLPNQCSRCGLVRKCGDPGYCPYGVGNSDKLTPKGRDEIRKALDKLLDLVKDK